ncbi:MAG: PH domain-containing protein [Acidobacteria bacterium]|nr:PH domain-containing protein [Acidobacteriota bacterium]
MQFDNFTPPPVFENLGQGQRIFEGRLHPLTLVIGLTRYVRALIPALALLLFGNRWAGLPVVFVTVIGLGGTLIKYFSFRYRIEGNELITQEGLLERRQRNIPLERIQEISVEQGVLHRLLSVVDAKIETGSGHGTEARLSVITRTEAERLRQAVFARAAAIKSNQTAETVQDSSFLAVAPVNAAPESKVIRRLGFKDLVIAGLTSNHLLSALVLVGALWNFADDLLPHSIYERFAKLIVSESKHLAAQSVIAAVAIFLLGLLIIAVVGIVFSVIGSIVLFYGFTFSRRGDDLQRRYGLLTQRSSSLPRRRIQVLEIEEKALRRLFGWATLRADTSGRDRDRKDDNHGRDVLLPILPLKEVNEVLPSLFPDFHDDPSEWRRVSKLAVRRETIEAAILCLILGIPLYVWRGSWLAILPLAVLPLFYLAQALSYRYLGYALGNAYFRTRRGWLGRSTHIVPINKIQAVQLRQTVLDRWWGVASLLVDTAGQAYTGGGPQINNLPLQEARELAKTLARRAAVTEYKW